MVVKELFAKLGRGLEVDDRALGIAEALIARLRDGLFVLVTRGSLKPWS